MITSVDLICDAESQKKETETIQNSSRGIAYLITHELLRKFLVGENHLFKKCIRNAPFGLRNLSFLYELLSAFPAEAPAHILYIQ